MFTGVFGVRQIVSGLILTAAASGLSWQVVPSSKRLLPSFVSDQTSEFDAALAATRGGAFASSKSKVIAGDRTVPLLLAATAAASGATVDLGPTSALADTAASESADVEDVTRDTENKLPPVVVEHDEDWHAVRLSRSGPKVRGHTKRLVAASDATVPPARDADTSRKPLAGTENSSMAPLLSHCGSMTAACRANQAWCGC